MKDTMLIKYAGFKRGDPDAYTKVLGSMVDKSFDDCLAGMLPPTQPRARRGFFSRFVHLLIYTPN